MNANEAVIPSHDAVARVTAYEQPLNERMRNFLRLDFLYQQAVHHHTNSDPGRHVRPSRPAGDPRDHAAGDVRSEVLKELERQMAALSALPLDPVSTALARAADESCIACARSWAPRARSSCRNCVTPSS
jgi:hypothetical protein